MGDYQDEIGATGACGEQERLLAATQAALRAVVAADHAEGMAGFITNSDGTIECGQCAPMDGTGAATTKDGIVHESDCYMAAHQMAEQALANGTAALAAHDNRVRREALEDAAAAFYSSGYNRCHSWSADQIAAWLRDRAKGGGNG